MEDTVLSQQVFAVEDVALPEACAEFGLEFVKKGMVLIVPRLDLDGVGLATMGYQEVNLYRVGTVLEIRAEIEK